MHAEVLSSEGDQTAPSDSSVGSENDLSRGSTANVPPGGLFPWRVPGPCPRAPSAVPAPPESRVARECSPKAGGRLLPRLNTTARPIANKYREGKLQRTLKREFKRRETARRETGGPSKSRPSAETQSLSSDALLRGILGKSRPVAFFSPPPGESAAHLMERRRPRGPDAERATRCPHGPAPPAVRLFRAPEARPSPTRLVPRGGRSFGRLLEVGNVLLRAEGVAVPRRVGRSPTRPVLKHGPRSLALVRV
ncbi:hypothetical protein TNCT_488721 [Trichonephila clavata]|uniref:Uncharacterized protein n=1 Tax=Trichonephila clavata TaxID=2740835 RepID=A0A8X6LBL1_TRICU|nr:hypothetical protein TNCT_488721 [Trichonephila clavata]